MTPPDQTGRAPEDTVTRGHFSRAGTDGPVHELETLVRVAAKQVRAVGVVSLDLAPVEGQVLPPWEAGSHIDVVVDGVPQRQYSLCGDPGDRTTYRIGVLRNPDGTGSSRYLHDVLEVGQTLTVRGPRNHFPLLPAPAYLFIAGGIGITPLLPMIRTADAAGAQWQLVYGGRQRASMAFLEELAVHGDRVMVVPQDEAGLLDLDTLLARPVAGTLVYCCGPEPLLAAVEQRCATWPSHSLKVERFSPRPTSAPARTDSFEVVLDRTGTTLTVPADRSVLDVLRQAGVEVLSSCTQGTCGTCETGVLDGRPEHRDSILDESEREANDCMMVCVSRSLSSRLVLDL